MTSDDTKKPGSPTGPVVGPVPGLPKDGGTPTKDPGSPTGPVVGPVPGVPKDGGTPTVSPHRDPPLPPSPDDAKETFGSTYALIDVPNFNGAADASKKMRSYLRLGAADKNVAGKKAHWEWGEDLAVKAKKPTRLDGVTLEDADNATRSLPYKDEDIVFEDDIRKRDPSDGSWTVDQRKAESAKLHTKGGWRDHSDGNRITTTRGDKVEVIRGNYKLVVIGRQNKAASDDDDSLAGIASGFDISGGEVRGMGMNLGEFETTSVEWVEDDDGRYRVVEKNQKGDTYSIYWGDIHEEFFGEWKVDVTGSEDPDSYPKKVPDTKAPSKVNPKIVSKTWAESIEEYTGSAKTRVPSIKSETWAETVDELTDVLYGTTSNTRIGGGVAEATTIGGATTSATTVGGAIVESTVVGLGVSELTVIGLGTTELSIIGGGTQSISLVGAGEAELNLRGGPSVSIDLIPAVTEIGVGHRAGIGIGDQLEVSAGNKLSVGTGMTNEVYLGLKNSFMFGSQLELFIGLKGAIHLGPYFELKLEALDLTPTEDSKIGAKLKEMGFKIDKG